MEQRPPRPEPGAGLLALQAGEHEPGLRVDPAYRRLGYPEALPEVWLREEVVSRLTVVAAALSARDWGLLIWDGWRSPQLQSRLWVEYRNQLAERTGLDGEELDARAREFVSPPEAEGGTPAHQTGGAVDLTLCLRTGEPLGMGGEFDELSERSHPGFYERGDLTSAEAGFRDRRRFLAEAMSEQGFWRLPTEWWHFEYGTRGWADAAGQAPRFGPVAAA